MNQLNGVPVTIPVAVDPRYTPAPILQERLSSRSVTRRYHSSWEYVNRWRGTTLMYNWVPVALYACYCSGFVLLQSISCDKPDDDVRCNLIKEDVSEATEILFTLWMTFTAFLFQSYVSAAINRFNEAVGFCRGAYSV